MNDAIDVRHVLASVHVPTLVLYRSHEYLAHATRYMGERIPGAQVVALPGADHVPWEGDQEAVLARIAGFIETLDHQPRNERVLTTILCVASGAPGRVIDRADPVVRDALARFRGEAFDGPGEAVWASFDGPARAIRCAAAIAAESGGAGLSLRAGVHTGECEPVPQGMRGATVDVAAAILARAVPGEVLASSTVRDLVAGSGLRFQARGEVGLDVAGEARTWALFAAVGA